jgi:hypothetical protein
VNSGSVLHATTAQAIHADSASLQAITGLQTTNTVHTVPLNLGNGLINAALGDNQASVNFLSYLGGSSFSIGGQGPDSINSVVVQNEGGSNFIYAAGSVTDSTGRTDAFVAKLTDGATSAVWAVTIVPTTPGPDSASGLAINSNGVYVVGSFADPSSTPQTDGFVTQLDPGTGATITPGDTLAGSTFAAVATDSSGNVYIGGSAPNPNTAGETDALLLQTDATLNQNQSYGGTLPLLFGGNPYNSAVTSGNGLIVDSQGNAYFAGTTQADGNTTNETFPLYGKIDAAGKNLLWGFRLADITPTTPGPGQGTAVAFDPSTGNVVFTGGINDGFNAGNPLNQDLALGRADPTTGNLIDAGGFYYIWSVDNRKAPLAGRAGDWEGNALVVLADGSTIVVGAAYDPAAGTGAGDPASIPSMGIDVTMTHFVVTDDNTTQNTDGDPENIFGGSGTDIGLAAAIDPTMTTQTSNVNIYVLGNTTSADLPTTSGVIQPSYAGGSTTGFVGQATIL